MDLNTEGPEAKTKTRDHVVTNSKKTEIKEMSVAVVCGAGLLTHFIINTETHHTIKLEPTHTLETH